MNTRFALAAAAFASLTPAVAADNPPPAWGKPVNGLRAGLVILEDHRTPRVGDDIGVYLRLKNVSRQPIRLDYFRPALLGWSPRITDAKGKPVPISTPPFDYPVAPETATLKPGATLDFGFMTLAIRSQDGPASVLSATAICSPGRYRVTFPFRFEPHEKDAGTWEGELTTAPVTLTVR